MVIHGTENKTVLNTIDYITSKDQIAFTYDLRMQSVVGYN